MRTSARVSGKNSTAGGKPIKQESESGEEGTTTDKVNQTCRTECLEGAGEHAKIRRFERRGGAIAKGEAEGGYKEPKKARQGGKKFPG